MHNKTSALTLFLIFFLIDSFYLNHISAQNHNPVVQIGNIEIVGNQESDNVDSFLGIPFAMPPVGDLRWVEPQAYKFSEKVFNAQEFQPACMQGPRIVNWYKRLISDFDGDEKSFPEPVFSEDCLYLNIWRPKVIDQAKTLPVLVYIHGGSNIAGWSYEPNYHGHNYAEQGVILVSIPYRLGVFGFLVHEDFDEKNFALLDLISALQWINKNIQSFGGNPNNITVMGESSGANNINFLMASPLSKGLFQRVIHQSGGSSISFPSDISVDFKLGKKFEESLTVGKKVEDTKDYLKSLSSSEITNAASKIYDGHYFAPVVDGKVLLRPLQESVHNGYIHPVDLMIGSNRDEWSLYFDGEADVDAWLEEETSKKDSEELKSILQDIESPIRKLDLLITAKNYVCPSLKLANETRKNNKNAWVYSFERVRPGEKALKYGAFHGAELPYVFDTHDEWLPFDEIDKNLTKIMLSYWVEFAKSGNPNSTTSPSWQIFSPEIQETQILGDNIYNSTHPSRELCEVIFAID